MAIVAVLHAWFLVLEMVLWRRPLGMRLVGVPIAFAAKIFLLGCVIVAGVYGALTVQRGILYVQALPAVLALLAVIVARRESPARPR